MNYDSIATQIIGLKKADLALRSRLVRAGQLNEGYHPEMEALHVRNADTLNELIDEIGYPTVNKVGEEACSAAWLVIQHAISKPGFMKKCRRLLEKAVAEKKVPAQNLVYLTDRIDVFEGKPQQYGTQFDWDENGELSPNLFDDLTKVNERRKAVGLNTLEVQTSLIRRQAKEENQSPPINLESKKAAYEKWRRKVGWTV
ncbi:DUF6624 domain-containing protein [Neolewinella persica]|uniref:DUF6624 domain-containing protein n=1 Tax=Neolewinella persica TaxID=70998 RepID=UPI00037BE0E3|nr:DUF6624 domain-containing protein [Neolewinella persica]